MSYKLRCYTLFDITQTGESLRRGRNNAEYEADHILKIHTQANFDTILQIISLRSQPEVTSKPNKTIINLNDLQIFGYLFSTGETIENINCWEFEFAVQHASVFSDGITELGALYNDCDRVPMIKCGTEWSKLPNFLDSSEELRNIYFEVISND